MNEYTAPLKDIMFTLTDIGVDISSDAVQVFGGIGFLEEAGIAQIYRDVRITPIYEGTNGISEEVVQSA